MIRLRRILISGAFALIMTSTYASASGQVWGLDPADLSDRLAQGDRSLLLGIDFDDHRISDVRRLGDDASFAVGAVYSELDRPEVAQELWQIGWDDAVAPWDIFCLTELLDAYRHDERYVDLERLARDAVNRYPSDTDALAALTLALYRQDRFQEAYEAAGALRDLLGARLPADALHQETALWLAVSASSIDAPDWSELYRSLYRDYLASAVHSRVWLFLLHNSELLERFTGGEQLYFRAKQLLADGAPAEAFRLMTTVASDALADGLLSSPYGLLDYYRAAAASGQYTAGAERFAAIASAADPQVARRAWEYSGRLYRLQGAYAAAIGAFDACLSLPMAETDRQRVLWYRLTAAVRLDPRGTVLQLPATIPTLGDPGYFADALSELAGALCRLERFDLLLSAYLSIRDFATDGTLARYELALAGAIAADRLSPTAATAVSVDRRATPPDRAALLGRAASQTAAPYEALAAAWMLGRTGTEALQLAAATPPGAGVSVGTDAAAGTEAAAAVGIVNGAGSGAAAVDAPEEAYLSTCLAYSLLDRAVEIILDSPDRLERATIARAAYRLLEAERNRDAMNISFRLGPGPLNVGEMRARYPDAYGDVLDRLAEEEGIDRWLLSALVREESYFDPGIVSAAGAIGLMQLLPTTAEDVAARMRLGSYDLTMPEDNLRIGAHYVRMLLNQFGNPLLAIAAYNAGQGRVRQWERTDAHLGPLLFHQAIPYDETYDHIRKVIVSAAYYGYLYEGRAPTEAVELILGPRM